MRTNLLISFLAVVVLLTAVEGATRVRHWLKYKDSRALLYGYRYQQPIVHGYPVHINSMGLRGPDVEALKPPGAIRITMHGGSFVFGAGVPDEATISTLLQAKLNARAEGPRYEVINAGHGGENIKGVLESFTREGIPLKPDVSIIISAYNNFRFFSYQDERSLLWRLSQWLYRTSLFYATLRDKMALIIYKGDELGRNRHRVAIPWENVPRALASYRETLERIVALARENDIRLVFGLQPVFIPAGYEELQRLMDEARMSALEQAVRRGELLSFYEAVYFMQSSLLKTMVAVAKANGIPVVDCGEFFPSEKFSFYYLDPVHPNAEGTPYVAEALYRYFESSSPNSK